MVIHHEICFNFRTSKILEVVRWEESALVCPDNGDLLKWTLKLDESCRLSHSKPDALTNRSGWPLEAAIKPSNGPSFIAKRWSLSEVISFGWNVFSKGWRCSELDDRLLTIMETGLRALLKSVNYKLTFNCSLTAICLGERWGTLGEGYRKRKKFKKKSLKHIQH